MVSALSNIVKIPELRTKVIFTLVMFAVFRMGTHIPVPGVDPSAIERLFNSGTLFGLLDLFSGGALSKFSIFAMSITPYINASIIIQLLNVVIPTLEQWSKEGEEGHKKTTKVTRYFTVALAFLQAMGMSIGLKEPVAPLRLSLIPYPLCSVTTATSGRLNRRKVEPELPKPRVTNRQEPFSSYNPAVKEGNRVRSVEISPPYSSSPRMLF